MEKYAITWQYNYHRASIHFLNRTIVYSNFFLNPFLAQKDFMF